MRNTLNNDIYVINKTQADIINMRSVFFYTGMVGIEINWWIYYTT